MRVAGVDLARGFGLLAVFVAHTAPVGGDSPLFLRWLQLSDHVAAPLFTLLMGVSAGLAFSTAAAAGGQESRLFRRGFAIRAAALIVLGLLAGLAGTNVIPILSYLGVVALLLLPVLALRARWIILLSAVATALSAAIMPLAATATTDLYMQAALHPETAWPARTGATLVGFFFSDYGYRVSGLLALALAGLAVAKVRLTGRRVLGLAAVGTALVAVGVAGYAATGWSLVPYSGTATELVKAIGLACLALAACCGLAETPLARFLAPVSVLGTMTLTFYLAHIAVLGLWARLTGVPDDSWLMLFSLCAGSLIGAWLLRRHRRGPVESLVSVFARGTRVPA